MDRTVAEELMKSLHELSVVMNTVAAQIEQIDVEDQRLLLRRGIADLMGSLYADLMRPIVRTYPDLDPDKQA